MPPTSQNTDQGNPYKKLAEGPIRNTYTIAGGAVSYLECPRCGCYGGYGTTKRDKDCKERNCACHKAYVKCSAHGVVACPECCHPDRGKSYTPGAERAAREIRGSWIPINPAEDRAEVESHIAEIISRETGDLKLREERAEMLEALKDFVNAKDAYEECEAAAKAKELIAKVEGR